MDDIPLKRCLSCPEGEQWHPATAEYFNRHGDGLNPKCKRCTRKYQREYMRVYSQIPEVKAREQKYQKVYRQRPESKAYQRTYYHQHPEYRERARAYSQRPEVIEQRKVYFQRPEIRERARKRKQSPKYQEKRRVYNQRPDVKERTRTYQRSPEYQERKRKYARAYHRRPGNQERMQEYSRTHRQQPEIAERLREWRQAHDQRPEVRERKRVYNRLPKVKERRREYRQHPEIKTRHRVRQANRRARKREVGGNYTSKEIAALLIQQKYRCYSKRCGNAKFKRTKIKGQWKYEYHIDHIIPLSRIEYHPTNDISNIGLLCPSCNDSKGNKLLSEWPEGGILMWDGGLVVKRNLLTEHRKGFFGSEQTR